MYPATEGLHQLALRRMLDAALQRVMDGAIEELLPPELRERQALPDIATALRELHGPQPGGATDMEAMPARRRLAFEELLAHSLSMVTLRAQVRAQASGAAAGR